MELIQDWYNEWQEKLGKSGEGTNEDARFILPNACETRIIMTMNVRELRHFFSLRMCNRAQWEIREMAEKMHRLCLEAAPALFAFYFYSMAYENRPMHWQEIVIKIYKPRLIL